MHRRQRGQQAERRAEKRLRAAGLRLVTRNYRCRGGEIDLVMLDPDVDGIAGLVFVEVRRRGGDARVGSLDSVDQFKQQRLIHAARHFLMAHPEHDQRPCRFDVVGLDGDDEPRWIRSAFEL